MIKVNKNGITPKGLKKGIKKAKQHCAEFEKCSKDFRSGKTKMKFDNKIFGHESVKKELIRSQGGKCCFCEAHFSANSYGHIEHYRPKGSVRQDRDSKALKPGYYWLAYDWKNLYWCCPICNSSYKGDFFPLKDPNMRAFSHRYELSREDPLILDPGGTEDPRDHIFFEEELAVGKTCQGRITVEVIGLNRVGLCEDRLETLEVMKTLHRIVTAAKSEDTPVLGEFAEEAQRELDRAVGPEAKFSAMVADYRSNAA